MKRTCSLTALTLAAVLLASAPALALKIAMVNLTTPQKTLQADVVLTGKVVEVEKGVVEVPQPNSKAKVGYQVGVIRIADALKGPQDLTQVRVGWQVAAAAAPEPVDPAKPIRSSVLRVPNPVIALEPGQEGCFFLRKHPTEDFHVIVPFGGPLLKGTSGYEAELAGIKQVLKIVREPLAALKAEKQADRLLAASTLLQHYGQYPQVNGPREQDAIRQEPIGAEESKLILKALAEAKWQHDTDPQQGVNVLFAYLALTEKDGWKQPAFNGNGDFNAIMAEAFQKWIKAHGDNFRVRRWVVGKK